jgi:putative ABC transport system permease protein
MYALKIIIGQPFRFALTIGGIALCIMLMLFLMSIYKGVADGSVEYIRKCDADLWVLQQHATNILRSTSILTDTKMEKIRGMGGVQSVSPVLFILATVDMPVGPATIYLTGYDLETGIGGPPELAAGNNLTDPEQIILDRSFALKHHFRIGDKIPIKKDTLTVVGLSRGTNMFVIQYAFISLEKAHSLIGFSKIASCYLVKTTPGTDPGILAERIKSEVEGLNVFDHSSFLKNNIREMESGLLPLLYTVAFIGAIVLVAILSLILSVQVLERRNEFAILKAIGSPRSFIPFIVLKQALILSGAGMILSLILFFPMLQVIEFMSPEISASSSPLQILMVATGVILISLLSSIIPNQRLRHIYPLEVFIK